MFCVSVNLTASEWQQIQQQAQQQWPEEQLSRAEITRRFALIGTHYTRTAAALDKTPRAELERMAQELRASMTAPDTERLKH